MRVSVSSTHSTALTCSALTTRLVILAIAAICSALPAAADEPPVPTGLFVKFHVKPGKNAAFEAAFRKMQQSMREHEPGNAYYDLFVTVENPQLYVIMERYRDAAAVTQHNQSEHLRTVLAELKDLMDGPIEPQRLVLISAK
jgi:quinol monooxygenase YgiN